MIERDPLRASERSATIDLAVSILRHDLRNRFTAIRNAAYYIKRRAESAEPLTEDPRALKFFDIIESELDNAVALLDLTPIGAPTSELTHGSMHASIRIAVDFARVGRAFRITLDDALEDATFLTDAPTFAVGLRALVELLAESRGHLGSLHIRGRIHGSTYRIGLAVSESSDTGRASMAISLSDSFEATLARRLVGRCRGAIEFQDECNVMVCVDLPARSDRRAEAR